MDCNYLNGTVWKNGKDFIQSSDEFELYESSLPRVAIVSLIAFVALCIALWVVCFTVSQEEKEAAKKKRTNAANAATTRDPEASPYEPLRPTAGNNDREKQDAKMYYDQMTWRRMFLILCVAFLGLTIYIFWDISYGVRPVLILIRNKEAEPSCKDVEAEPFFTLWYLFPPIVLITTFILLCCVPVCRLGKPFMPSIEAIFPSESQTTKTLCGCIGTFIFSLWLGFIAFYLSS